MTDSQLSFTPEVFEIFDQIDAIKKLSKLSIAGLEISLATQYYRADEHLS